MEPYDRFDSWIKQDVYQTISSSTIVTTTSKEKEGHILAVSKSVDGVIELDDWRHLTV